jgi:hypothetical protein
MRSKSAAQFMPTSEIFLIILQLDSNIIRKLWNKLRDLVPANSNTGLLPPLTLRSGVQPQRGQWLCECKCAARRPHYAKIIEHGQVLSKKHEEQLLHLAVSTASLDISLQAVRKSVVLASLWRNSFPALVVTI